VKEQFILSDGISLKKPLGAWIHTNRNAWRYTINDEGLHDHDHQLQLSATIQSKHRRSTDYYQWTSEHYQPSTDHRTSTTIQGATTSTTFTALHRQSSPTPPPKLLPTQYPTFRDYTKSLPDTQRRLLQTYTQSADEVTLWRAMRSKQTLTIASNGGLKTHKGT
jgi:hypothetical protein